MLTEKGLLQKNMAGLAYIFTTLHTSFYINLATKTLFCDIFWLFPKYFELSNLNGLILRAFKFQTVLLCFALVCSGLHWFALFCSGLVFFALLCSVLFWFALACNISSCQRVSVLASRRLSVSAS